MECQCRRGVAGRSCTLARARRCGIKLGEARLVQSIQRLPDEMMKGTRCLQEDAVKTTTSLHLTRGNWYCRCCSWWCCLCLYLLLQTSSPSNFQIWCDSTVVIMPWWRVRVYANDGSA